MTVVQALAADDFVASVGVNVHPHYGVTDPTNAYAGNWVPLVTSLGIRHVRANVATSGAALAADKAAITALNAAGIGYMFQVTGSADLTAVLAAGLPVAPETVEPWNEWDASSGESGTTWATDITTFQPSLYSTVKAHWPSAAVLGASLADNSKQATVGSLAPNADAANVHVYQSPAGDPEGAPAFSSAQVNSYLTQAPGKPLWITETGWSAGAATDTGVWTTELAQARLLPRALLHCFAPAPSASISSTPYPTGRGGLGAQRTYIYELLDEHNPATSDQDRFGLFRHDLSPKPAATAVGALLQLLSDPGPAFTPPSLDIAISGYSGDFPNYLLLAKRDGTLWLAFWRQSHVSAYPGGGAPAGTLPLSGADNADTGQAVTFTFGQAFGAVTLYRPLNGTAGQGFRPGSRVTVSAQLDVQLLRLASPGAAVPAVPQVPAGWKPVQADMDAWVTVPLSFSAAPPVFRAELHAAATVSGWTLAALDTVLEDPYGGWSAVATANQPAFSWLCPAGCGGWYEASLSVFLAAQSGTANQAAAALYLNGTVWQYAGDDWADNGLSSGAGGPAVVPLQPGDYVQLYLYATASTTASAIGGRYPSMELAWVSS